MAELAGSLVDALLERCRDQQALGITPVVDDNDAPQPPSSIAGRAFARRLLSHAQMLINGFEEMTLASFMLTTYPYQLVYPLSGVIQTANGWATNAPADDCVRIVGVRSANRDLSRVSFRSLAHIDRHWFRNIGSAFTTWTMIGNDQVVLYPALTVRSSVSLIYVQRTPYLATDDVATVVDDHVLPQVLDVAQALYHLKHRDVEFLPMILKRLSDRYDKQIPDKDRA